MTENELLNRISEVQFVCVELNLYLDTHPADEDARADMLAYSGLLTELIADYESQYGPLLGFGHSPTDKGCWVNSAWPWEKA